MKGRKLLAGGLSAAMVLGTMAFPAFAEENPGTDPVKEFMNLKAQSVNDTHEIDLNGAIVNVDGEYWSNIYADITIKNGTINFSDFDTPDGIFRIGYWSCAHPVTLTLENMTINVTDVTASTGVFTMQNQDDTLVLNNSTINATEITNTPGIFYTPNGVDSVRGSVEINGGSMNLETDSALFFNNDVDLNSTVITCEVDRPVFRQSAGSVENTTITVNDVIDGATRGIVEDIAGNPDGTVEFKNSNVKAPEGQTLVKINTSGKVLAVADADSTYTTVDDSENETSTLMTSVVDVKDVGDIVASIGSAKYLTFADALAAAEDGETITLFSDVSIGQTNFKNSIDLNNNILTFTATDSDVKDADVTFSNGNIVANNLSTTAQGIIRVRNGKTLTLDNVNFTCNDTSTTYMIDTENANLKICNGSVINVNNLSGAGIVFVHNGNTGTTVVEDSEITISNADTGFLTTRTEGTLEINNTNINLSNVADGLKALNSNIIVDSSTVNVVDCETGAKIYSNGGIEFTGTSIFNVESASVAGILLKDAASSTVASDNTAVVNADVVYENVTDEAITDNITVNLVPTDDESVYDIVLDGNYKAIYEFVSAELQFVNESKTLANTDMSYEITGTDDINVIANTDKPNRYGFYLKDGEVDNRITATEIVIGQVTFPAQGTIKFKVDADNSKVVATEYKTHHEKYYTAADQNAKLTADANGINSTITAKIRDVLVKVDYAHELVGSWTDNKITVTLKNAFGETSDAMDISDGEEPFAKVPVGRITVTLKAPGFRTYTYTTTVGEGTDPLVLSFWNDTKRDTIQSPKEAIEAGKDPIANNFVVGDIAMDYIVDKYDLAAVTSYYGTYNLTDEKKIRYDLNRDGSIDITDVAYVLHNFGF